jgi:hypothetical protein
VLLASLSVSERCMTIRIAGIHAQPEVDGFLRFQTDPRRDRRLIERPWASPGRRDGRPISQLRMLIREMELTAVNCVTHVRLLFACASMRLLNVSEIRIDVPRNLGLDTTCCRIPDRHTDGQPAEGQRIDGTQRQGPVRDPVSVGRDVISGLAATTPAEFRQLRVDMRERHDVRFEKRRLAQPR